MTTYWSSLSRRIAQRESLYSAYIAPCQDTHRALRHLFDWNKRYISSHGGSVPFLERHSDKTTKCPSWVVQTRASQIQDGGWPPSWKNRKVTISQLLADRYEIWYDDMVWPIEPFRCYNFQIFKIQDGGGRHFEKSKNRHISAKIWLMATKFSPVTHVDPLDRVECQNFENFKSQDGGGRYSKKNRKKSPVWLIVIILHLLFYLIKCKYYKKNWN